MEIAKNEIALELSRLPRKTFEPFPCVINEPARLFPFGFETLPKWRLRSPRVADGRDLKAAQ